MGVGVLTQTLIQCHSNLISAATMNISDIISKVLVFFLSSFSVIVVYFIVGLTEKQLMLAGENCVLQPPPIRH